MYLWMAPFGWLGSWIVTVSLVASMSLMDGGDNP